MSGRFQFPGYSIIAFRDTSTHDIETGKLVENGRTFVVKVMRSRELADLVPFVVAEVSNDRHEKLWAFRRDEQGDKIVGLLAKVGESHVIALCESGKEGKVIKVISFASLLGAPSHNIRAGLTLKQAAAEFLGKRYKLTKSEETVNKVTTERVSAAEQAAREAEREERARRRRERVTLIKSRPKISGYTAKGSKRFGYPVTKDEWASMPNHCYVILVESIGEGGVPGPMIEAFQVQKEGGNPKKGFALPVKPEVPQNVIVSNASQFVQPVHSVVIEKDTEKGKDMFEVQVYASAEDLRQARKQGLNSGTYVAIQGKRADGKIEVYAAFKEKMDTVGSFTPLG